jgi:hypothetical protein
VQCLYDLFAVLIFTLHAREILVQEAVQVLVVYENLRADKVEEGEKLLQVVLKRGFRDQ